MFPANTTPDALVFVIRTATFVALTCEIKSIRAPPLPLIVNANAVGVAARAILLSTTPALLFTVIVRAAPADMKALIDAFEAGDMHAARMQHYRLFTLCRDLLGLASNPIPIKAAMAMVGRDTGEIRLPLVPLEQPLVAKLRRALADYGLAVQPA